MNQYELGVIVSTKIDEESQKIELDNIQELVSRFGGTIDKIDTWGRRKLAYPIQKQNDGFYSFITFSSESGTPAELESRIRILENILRFMIVKVSE